MTDDRADELVLTLVELGVDPAAARAAVKAGDPERAVFEPVILAGIAERTVTPADVEAQGGLTVEECGAVMRAFGFPEPAASDPAFTPTEAEVLVELKRLQDIWPPSLTLQLARVYAEMLSRVASSEAQAFFLYTVPELRRLAPNPVTELRAVHSAFEELLPLADPLLLGVHRRWIEHELAQAAVRDAETRAGVRNLPGAADVSFLFCDLKDFTRYAEIEGDAAAIAAIDNFFDVVTRARGDDGRLIKSLGDGAMLVYPDPTGAVTAGARIIAMMRQEAVPGVHAAVHHGLAIAREGDYFGTAVNLAARLLALSGRDELVTTSAVVEATGSRFHWLPLGPRTIRGVADPLPIFRLVES
jgi:adenylate cyclase